MGTVAGPDVVEAAAEYASHDPQTVARAVLHMQTALVEVVAEVRERMNDRDASYLSNAVYDTAVASGSLASMVLGMSPDEIRNVGKGL